MSNSSYVNYTKLSPNYSSRNGNKISRITIHHMAGNLTVEGCGSVFTPSSRQASSNYGIGSDGRVGLYVDEKYRAWTSSSRANDQIAVTIEVADDRIGKGSTGWHSSTAAMSKLVLLCADICRRNGIAKLNYTGNTNGNLTLHKWFAATGCPGDYLEKNMSKIASEVNKLLSSGLKSYTWSDNASSTAPSTSGTTKPSTSSGASTNKLNTDFPSVPFVVTVLVDDLRIRKTPSSDNNSNLTGKVTGKGKFTISQLSGKWGKLKSGAGWIWLGNSNYVSIGGTSTNTFKEYTVRVTTDVLNIRKGAGTQYAITGSIKNKGVYTIVAESNGNGASKWGKLKSGAGWIALDYCKKI